MDAARNPLQELEALHDELLGRLEDLDQRILKVLSEYQQSTIRAIAAQVPAAAPIPAEEGEPIRRAA
jgi:hypothetical protein